jgi:tetraacyldisaccharide 4'-kinase
MSVRNLLFDAGILNIHRMEVPVISVGNIAVGGTGKTPMVEYIAGHLKDRGLRVAVLSRGYGRMSTGYQVVSNGYQRCAEAITAGDEPAQMADTLQGVVVAVDENRVHGARQLLQDFRPEVIILDDGFQHRSLGRALDLLLMRASDILGKRRLLPAGYLREPLTGLRRADLVGVSGWQDEEAFSRAVSVIQNRTSKPVIGYSLRPQKLRRLLTGDVVSNSGGDKPVAAFSGIARPEGFEHTLKTFGIDVAVHVAVPDHYWYRPEDLHSLARKAGDSGARSLVTTQKDAVRLLSVQGIRELDAQFPVLVLETGVVIEHGREILIQHLEALCR